jgi:hypothetical protein
MNVYSFRIAYTSEDELHDLQEQKDFDPDKLVLTVLLNGQPSYKTLYARAETEEEAISRVDMYVSQTSYCNIEDKRFI